MQAQADQANCALVASLPFLQKELDEMQQQAPPPQGTNSQVSGSAASRRGLHFPPGALTGIAAMAHNWRALRFAA